MKSIFFLDKKCLFSRMCLTSYLRILKHFCYACEDRVGAASRFRDAPPVDSLPVTRSPAKEGDSHVSPKALLSAIGAYCDDM